MEGFGEPLRVCGVKVERFIVCHDEEVSGTIEIADTNGRLVKFGTRDRLTPWDRAGGNTGGGVPMTVIV